MPCHRSLNIRLFTLVLSIVFTLGSAFAVQNGKASPRTLEPSSPLFFDPLNYGPGLFDVSSVVIADTNGDGKADLVITGGLTGSNVFEGSVSVILGNGDGTFQSPVSYNAGGTSAYSVAVADLNGDGKPDIVVIDGCASGTSGINCSPEGVVGVLLNNGNGTYQDVVTYGSGGSGHYRSQLAVADVNGDGKLDLVTTTCGPIGATSCGNGIVSVLLGNGDGTFQSAVSFETGAYGSNSLVIGDVNGDGKPDVIVASYCTIAASSQCIAQQYSEGAVSVLLGNGDGTFQSAVLYDSGGILAFSIALQDVNGDGKLDLFVGNCGSNFCGQDGDSGVGVLLGNGDGTFKAPVTYASGGPDSLAVADVNHDGKPDLVIADSNGGAGILLGNGDGSFQPEQSYGTNEPSESLAVGDVNGDGAPDIVLGTTCLSVCLYDGPAAVFLNLGKHIFTTTTLTSALNPSIVGQSVTFTAGVSADRHTPVGTVIFSDGATVLGTQKLFKGSASITISSLAAGGHSITVSYPAVGNFLTSSATLEQIVNEPPTTTVIAVSANPAAPNTPVTFTATVTNQTGTAITGAITFLNDNKLICNQALVNDQASCTASFKIGDYTVSAVYSGDANNSASAASPIFELVSSRLVQTQTLLATSGSPVIVGQPVTFTATVTWRGTPISNSGDVVTFYDGTSAIGSSTTIQGVATFTTSSLAARTHFIKAVYAGDSTFLTSAARITQIISKSATATSVMNEQRQGEIYNHFAP